MTPTVDGTRRVDVIRARTRIILLGAALTVIGLGLVTALSLNAREVAGWADLGAWSAIVVGSAGAALIVGMVPASLVAGACGFALGTLAGLPVALAAVTVGGVLCATIARGVGTAAAADAFGARLRSLVRWVDARPRRAVILVRLVPGMPFNAASYAFGVTSVRYRDLVIGTMIGFAPRCFAYVALGGSLGNWDAPESRVAFGASALLLVLVIVVPRVILARAASTREKASYG